jgi:hypothetical protein
MIKNIIYKNLKANYKRIFIIIRIKNYPTSILMKMMSFD